MNTTPTQELVHLPAEVPAIVPARGEGEELLRLAIEKGADVGTLERLMAMRRELRAEQAKEAFDRAMSEFQRACPAIIKSEGVTVKGSLRYKFAPLDVIIAQTKELIHDYGFSYKVDAKIDGTIVLATCEVKHTAGHSETSSMQVPIDPEAYMSEQQKFASAFTFAKRYAFCSAFGIVTADQDDDGRGQNHPDERPKAPPARPTPQNRPSQATPAPAPQANATAGGSTPPKTPPTPLAATPEQRLKLIDSLAEAADLALEYFQKLTDPSVLMENDTLADLPLWAVPTTAKQFEALKAKIADFGNGNAPVHAYPPNPEAIPSKAKAKPVEVPRDAQTATPEAGEEWRTFPMPWGKQAGTPLEELEKRYLYGLWCNYKVETEYNGRPKKPEQIANDELFRKHLDAAGTYYKFEKKD